MQQRPSGKQHASPQLEDRSRLGEPSPGESLDVARAADRARYRRLQRRLDMLEAFVLFFVSPTHRQLTAYAFAGVLVALVLSSRLQPFEWVVIAIVGALVFAVLLADVRSVLGPSRRIPPPHWFWSRYRRWKARTLGVTEAAWPKPRRARHPSRGDGPDRTRPTYRRRRSRR